MNETTRIILGLRSAGWDSKEINDFIIWIATGDEQYRPEERKAAERA